ncbi:hypothetical protein ILYODFUR_004282, partial [Ilyodon furcidens]
VKQFWEYTFQCKFNPADREDKESLCTGDENMELAEREFLDVSNLRPEYNVYKAVYALAYALHDMMQCEPGKGPFSGHSCASLEAMEPWQLLHYLQKVNFSTQFGDQVSFDEKGDALPIYDVMNWLQLPDGKIKIQNVGEVKKSDSGDEELTLDEDKIFWNTDLKKPIRSVCSESCPPGTRMARERRQPECCFSYSLECFSCLEDFWSSPQRDHCIPKKTEFLSYQEPLGICLTTTSLLGTFICAIVLGIFIYHRSTPIVRANNSELSFLLLVSLKLCFLCSLLFIGRPRLLTCQLRHAAFGISFVLCVSCILVKTMVVLAVFKASKPGVFSDLSFTSEPQHPTCYGFDVLGFRQAQTMAFAIDEINRNSQLLPNMTLGYMLYDNCVKLGIGFRAALALISGQEEQIIMGESCEGRPPVLGIVGDSSSTRSIAISTVLGLYRVPMVSYFATCSCLSDRQKFPSFFRTIPSDAFQVNAMIQILKHFGWTWVGLLISDDDYGLNAARAFQSDLSLSGEGCLAYLEVLPWGNEPPELRRIVDVMKKSTSRVVIVFAHESHLISLMEEVFMF